MKYENIKIVLGGSSIDELYKDLISLEVELDEELVAMYRLRIALSLESDGNWTWLDDERLQLWKEVAIEIGFEEDGTEEIISGPITHVRPAFDPDPTQCSLEIWGMDRSVLLDREEKLKDWPNKKDSDIAREIFMGCGLRAVVDDTKIIHDEKLSTIIQRETDMQFLRRLSRRNGFECFVEGRVGYFRKPQSKDVPQPTLAAHFGDETSLNRLDIEVDGLKPAGAAMLQVDRVNKKILDASSNGGVKFGTALGKNDADSYLGGGAKAAKTYIGNNAATGLPEMTALCEGVRDSSAWFVTADGEIAGNAYGHALRPRRTVTIKGIGETHSGVYRVSRVVHAISSEGYVQRFRARRNALCQTGLERYAK